MSTDGLAAHAERGASGPTAVSGTRRSQLAATVRAHPIATVFVVALVVRVLMAIVFFVLGVNARIAPDSGLYLRVAEHLAGVRSGSWGRQDAWYRDHYATYVYPVSVLFRVFGPHEILAQLVAAVFGAIAAAATTRLATEILPTMWALAVGAVVAFYPSMSIWSAVPLRDSAVWACTACLALAVMLLARARSPVRFALLASAIAASLFLLGHLRVTGLCIAGIALVIQAIFGPMRYRLATIAMAIGLALVVPMLVGLGLGPGGINFITSQDLGYQRAHLAGRVPSVNSGVTYDVESAFESGGSSDLAHIPQGLKDILLEPLPWTSLHGETVTLGRLESPLWWALVLASLTGVPLLWRTRRVLGFPALYAAGLLMVLVLAEGNFGTAYRHRAELIWPMALLAGAGLHAMWERRSQRRREAVAA